MAFVRFIQKLPWPGLVLFSLTLGLAPFNPPHVVEKLNMLVSGNLVRAMDWFDLLMHGSPWVLVLAKAVITLKEKRAN